MSIIAPKRVKFFFGLVLYTVFILQTTLVLGLALKYLADALAFKDHPTLNKSLLSLVYLLVASPTIFWLSQHLLASSALEASHWVRCILQKKAFDQDVAPITSILTNDLGLVEDSLTGTIPEFCSNLIAVIGSMVLLLSWDKTGAVLAVLFSVIVFCCSSLFVKPVKTASKIERECLSNVLERGMDLARGIPALKGLKATFHSLRWYEETIAKHFSVYRRKAKIIGFQNAVVQLITTVFQDTVLLSMGKTSIVRASTPGITIGTYQVVNQGILPVSELAQLWINVQSALGVSERVNSFVEIPPENPVPPRTRGSSPVSIEFSNVAFSYTGTSSYTLKSISFKVRPGEKVAIVGPSGSGKSTILKVLTGMLHGYTGQVILSDASGRVFPDSLLISWCPQTLDLFRTALVENLTLVSETWRVEEEIVDRVVKAFRLEELVQSLEQGWVTPVESLSGGQKQRVAVARAFLTPSPLVVLDEPTSHLATRDEWLIYDGIREMGEERTIVFATHRVVNLGWTDSIVVISGGQVVEQGQFNELLTTNREFRELYDKQKLSEGR